MLASVLNRIGYCRLGLALHVLCGRPIAYKVTVHGQWIETDGKGILYQVQVKPPVPSRLPAHRDC